VRAASFSEVQAGAAAGGKAALHAGAKGAAAPADMSASARQQRDGNRAGSNDTEDGYGAAAAFEPDTGEGSGSNPTGGEP
jgi:hypothetical protein